MNGSQHLRTITLLTLVFLPGSFVASLLGMNSSLEARGFRRTLIYYLLISIVIMIVTLSVLWLDSPKAQRQKKYMMHIWSKGRHSFRRLKIQPGEGELTSEVAV